MQLSERIAPIEFSYPDESLDQTHDFTLDSTTNDLRLTFKHKNATYRIYDRPDRDWHINRDRKERPMIGREIYLAEKAVWINCAS